MMKRYLKYLLLVFFATGCSTTNRYQYYKLVSKEEKNILPEVTQKPEKLYLIYNETPRSIFQYNYVRRVWIAIKNYSRKPYSFGPIFLPIVPYFVAGLPLDHSQNITIVLTAYLDPIYGERILSLPNLIIENSEGRILNPLSVNEDTSGFKFKSFTYDTTIDSSPWFILQEASIKLDNGKILKIPRMRFDFTNEFIINWNEPIAP